MDEPRFVDVAPVPADHEAGPSCWCEPVHSVIIGSGQLLVHRTDRAAPFGPHTNPTPGRGMDR